MTRLRKLTIILIACLVAFEAYYLARSGRAEQVISRTRLLMGTSVEIKVPLRHGHAADMARDAIEKAFGEVERIEGALSVFKESSEIARVNRLKAGEKMCLSDETFGLIETSASYGKKVQCVFDVTIKPLVDLWKAAAKNNALPTAAEIERARALVGYDKIVLDASERSITFLKDGMGIDLGGVAKGYAADRAAKMLRDNGIFDAVVSCGSGMYCMGKKSDGKPWRIGIRHPRHKGSVVFELSVTDKGVDTSGDYEKCFVINGKRYSHIIDPRSGYPAEGASSATVIADSSVIADIMATASCIIGRSALDALAGSVDEEAVLLYVDGISLKVSMTKGALEKYDIREKVF